MVNIRGYLSLNFTKTFLTIFIPFFFIISLVYLVKISLLTAKIQITFPELIQLFSYYVPAIMFYALPLSFIASVATVLLRLSADNELIALFSLGLPVHKVMRPLVLISILFSILLLIISFGAMPQSKQLYSSFKHVKKEEMAFNVIPEEMGQKFGDHYMYIQDENDGILQKVVIYSQDQNGSDQIFSADRGTMDNSDGIFSMTLLKGKGYTFSPNTLQQIDYKKLKVYDALSRSNFNFEGTASYWKKSKSDEGRKRKLFFFLFVSLIPFLSLYAIASFSIINPRYQKNHSFAVIGFMALFFYMIASSLNKYGTPLLLVLAVVGSFLLGYGLFRRTASRFF